MATAECHFGGGRKRLTFGPPPNNASWWLKATAEMLFGGGLRVMATMEMTIGSRLCLL